jgi:hypothetical protein
MSRRVVFLNIRVNNLGAMEDEVLGLSLCNSRHPRRQAYAADRVADKGRNCPQGTPLGCATGCNTSGGIMGRTWLLA